MTRPLGLSALLAGLALLAMAPGAAAQPSAVHRTPLQDQDFPPPSLHTVTVRVVVDRGGEVTPHTHPGVEMGYVLAGHAMLKIAGSPDRTLAAGDSFSVPPRIVHSVRNTGPGALTLLSTYVVEKGEPIASPAP
jgi:quercetin dioxygenase-like cupin family protein